MGIPQEVHHPFLAGKCSGLSRAGGFCPLCRCPLQRAGATLQEAVLKKSEREWNIPSSEYCPDELIRKSHKSEDCDI